MISLQEYKQLLLEIEKLRQVIAEQKEHIAALSNENKKLKEKLGTNSSNSSKPPSQDPHRSSRSSQPTGKKPGGQPGHTGHKRRRYSREEISKMIDVRPEVCPDCAAMSFELMPVAVEIRQVIDLPEITPEVTQYNIHTCKCKCCWKHVRGTVPKEAERGFGPRLMEFVTMLAGEGHLTKRKICSITAHLGLRISLGALCNICKLAANLLQEPAECIWDNVLKSGKVNADETSWRVSGKRCWMWVGAMHNATFFKIDPSRSMQAYERIFGRFEGTLTTDRYGAYNQHAGRKQSCLAHIDRHFIKMSQREGIDGSIGRILEGQFDQIFGFWHEFKADKLSREELQKKAADTVENIKAVLIFATKEAKNSKSKALAHDLLNRFSTLWTFLYEGGVEPTNNLAERGLRPAVIFRKLSMGNHSEWGARFTERLLSVVCTLKQNARNPFKFLTELFEAHQNARSPPPIVL